MSERGRQNGWTKKQCPLFGHLCFFWRDQLNIPRDSHINLTLGLKATDWGYTFLSLGTVTWHNTHAPPGRRPGLAKLLLTSKTPSVAPAIPGPRRSPLDPRRHRQCAPVGLVAPVSGLLFVCHRAPGTRDLLSHFFLPQRIPAPPTLSLSRDSQDSRAC